MPRIRIVTPLPAPFDGLPPGTIVETHGPVSEVMQAWLTAGQAELLFERVGPPDDDGQVPPPPVPRR
jgi:hypothetical protein